MALAATHMCFALDVKDRFKIGDIAKYIQGTVYPDSRYVSGINRELTHSNDFLKKSFASNDFNTGWQVHLIYDKIQRQTFHQNIPGFDKFIQKGYQENQWINFSAAKIVADINAVKLFDIQSILPYLNSEFCPNNEDVSVIRRNNEIMIELYKNKRVPSLDDYMDMWIKLGISDELGEKIRAKTIQFMNNDTKEIIWSCYDKILRDFDKYYEQLVNSK